MKLTRSSNYALHALAFMAQQKNNRPVASHHIALVRGIPDRFLLKVLKFLVGVRILKSVKGPNGGYELARAPSDISLLQIIEAVDGPIRGNAAMTEKSNAALNAKLESICNTTAEGVRKHLDKISLSELVAGLKKDAEPARGPARRKPRVTAS